MKIKNVHPEYQNVTERREILQNTYTSVQRVIYNSREEKKDKDIKDAERK